MQELTKNCSVLRI